MKRSVLMSVAGLALSIGGAGAQEVEITAFQIEPQSLSSALLQYGEQGGVEVLFRKEDVQGKLTQGVTGEFSSLEAAGMLLNDAGIEYRLDANGTLLVGAGYQRQVSASQPFRMAQANTGKDAKVARVDVASGGDEGTDEKDEIIVTGTSIKGTAPVGSPVLAFDRQAILESGQTSLEAFLRTVPQLRTVERTDNVQGSKFIDIGGLGADATLVLINGRRVAPGVGGDGSTDVATIPVAMVERIEILTDGASAIYGADAIGGVVNIILRRDFTGAETDYLWGAATQGGASEHRITQTLGTGWGSGNVILGYTYNYREPVLGVDRDPTSAAAERFPGIILLQEKNDHTINLSALQELGESMSASFNGKFYHTSGERPDTFAPETLNTIFKAQQLDLSAGFNYQISDDWSADLTGTLSTRDNESTNVQGTTFLDDALTAHVRSSVEGALFPLPGGSARLAAGAEWRREDYSSSRVLTDGRTLFPLELDTDIFSGFAELYAPLVGDGNAIPFVHALNVSVAGRYDSYRDYGGDIVPKIGVDWFPVEGLKFRASWGESFRAPSLSERLNEDMISLVLLTVLPDTMGTNANIPNRSVVGIIQGTTSLNNERSTNLSLGLDFTPSFMPGFDASITYNSVDFVDRIQRLRISLSQEQSFSNLITRRSADSAGMSAFDMEIDRLAALPPPTFFFDARARFGAAGEPVTVLIDSRTTNLANTRRKAIDFDLGYVHKTGSGDEFEARVGGVYIVQQGVRAAEALPFTDDINRVGRPADLRLRNQLSWKRDGASVDFFVNWVNGYESQLPGFIGEKIDSHTTVDLTAAYVFGGPGLLDGLRLGASATNLFDAEPPFVSAFPGGFNYDTANANALGRVVSVNITKAW